MAQLGYIASHMWYGSGAGEDLKTQTLRFQLIRERKKKANLAREERWRADFRLRVVRWANLAFHWRNGYDD